MLRLLLTLLSIAALLFIGTASMYADVITFDDLSGSGQVPNGYHGVTWNDQWAYYDASQPPYNPASGLERVYNYTSQGDRPQDAGFNFGTPVSFDGAYFAGYPITTVNFDLYLGGMLVASSATLNPTGTPTFLPSGYAGPVDQVIVHDTGAFGVFDYYVMDDVTFHASAVPEPAAIFPLCGLLAVMGLAVRRRVRVHVR